MRFRNAVVAGFLVVAAAGCAGSTADPAADPAIRFATADPVAVGIGPADVEAGAGALWVSGADDGTLTRVDPDTGSTTRIDVGGEPGQIVVADDAVWVRNLGDAITRVDIATGAVSPPIPVGRGPISGMAVGGGSVWLSHQDSDAVTRLDAVTLEVVGDPIRVEREPRAMEFSAGRVYVLGSGDGTVSRIDAATGEVTGSVRVGDSVGGIEVDGGVIYVAADGTVVPVSEQTFVPGPPYAFIGWSYFEVNGGVVWVVHDEEPAVRRYDATERVEIGEPVTGVGADVGRARWAFGRLWMTVPDRNALIALAPTG